MVGLPLLLPTRLQDVQDDVEAAAAVVAPAEGGEEEVEYDEEKVDGRAELEDERPSIYKEVESAAPAEPVLGALEAALVAPMPPRLIGGEDTSKPAPDVSMAKTFGKQFYSFSGATRDAKTKAKADKTEEEEREDNWAIGFDVTSPEMVARQKARAARFGVGGSSVGAAPTSDATEGAEGVEGVEAAEAAAAGENGEAAEAAKPKEVVMKLPKGCVVDPTPPIGEDRQEALHVYGTDSMSTKDIIGIFAVRNLLSSPSSLCCHVGRRRLRACVFGVGSASCICASRYVV
jgi:hypothetical protein